MNIPRSMHWTILTGLVLAVILVPWFIWGSQIDAWIDLQLKSPEAETSLLAAILSLLLASDILLPVPSSIVSTALGFLLNFPGGLLASWLAMTVSSTVGYWLALAGRPLARKLLGETELKHLDSMERRVGDWIIVVCRPVPVLAEASVLFAGMGRMPAGRFMMLSVLSNFGVSAVYAAVGAFSASVNSFLLAFAGSIIFPALAMLLVRRRGRGRIL